MPIEIPTTSITVATVAEQTLDATHGYIDALSINGKGVDGTRRKPTIAIDLTPYLTDEKGNPTFAIQPVRVRSSDAYATAQYVPEVGVAEAAIFAAAQAMVVYREKVRKPTLDTALETLAKCRLAEAQALAAANAMVPTVQAARAAFANATDDIRKAATVARDQAESDRAASLAAFGVAKTARINAEAVAKAAQAAYDDVGLPPVTLPS